MAITKITIVNVASVLIGLITIFILILVLPHTTEYIEWQNTEKACDWCTNGSGCSCSGYAGWCVEEYRKAHNLTTEEFPTYIIANNELPPMW